MTLLEKETGPKKVFVLVLTFFDKRLRPYQRFDIIFWEKMKHWMDIFVKTSSFRGFQHNFRKY